MKSEKEVFDNVWSRVSGAPAPESVDARSEAEAFIRAELADAAKYAYLAKISGNTPAARTLRRLSMDEARHARELRTVYCLAYGESPSLKKRAVARP